VAGTHKSSAPVDKSDHEVEAAVKWYSVRCLFKDSDSDAYEERITLWYVANFEAAIESAEAEGLEYARNLGMTYIELAQAFWLADEPASGSEVFSLIRQSELSPEDYKRRFFNTGSEIQRNV
jgi:hypothetical protein